MFSDVNFCLLESLNVCFCYFTGETKLAVDIWSELKAECLACLIVLNTPTGLVEDPGLRDVPGVFRVSPGRVEEETVRTSGQDKHLPGTGGYGEDTGHDGGDDGGGEYDDHEDSVEAPHTDFRGCGRQEEHEETRQDIEADGRKKNVEKNIQDLSLVQDVVLISVDEVEVDDESDDHDVGGENC